MKPVQTQDVQELLYTLAMQTDSQKLRHAAADMIERLEEEREQKAQAVYYAVLDEMSQANINALSYENNSLEDKNERLKQVVRDMAELL